MSGMRRKDEGEEMTKCCCNCLHNIRTGEPASITCHCDIDGHYIGYVACFEDCCDDWKTDAPKWAKESTK